MFASIASIGLSRALAREALTEVIVLRQSAADVALAEIANRAWAELNAGGNPGGAARLSGRPGLLSVGERAAGAKPIFAGGRFARRVR